MPPLKIAYFLLRFPHLTETFILREMIYLRRAGVDVNIFSLVSPAQTETVHHEVQEMTPFVHYSSFLSMQVVLAQLYFLVRSPGKYLAALGKALWQAVPDSGATWRVVLTFPKAVYFAKKVDELGIQHIHAHFVWINGIAAQIAADLTGITFSLHPHAWGLFMRNQTSVKKQLETANKIITVSDYHQKYIEQLCPGLSPNNIEIVNYGLDPTEFQPVSPPPPILPEGCIEIISVASLIEKKGHEYLIKACAQLAAKNYKFHCSIIGSGPLRKKLQNLIDELNVQDQVFLLGPKKQVEVKEYYQKSHIFALACVISQNGDRDGMPNVLLEAMALNIPVVTTPIAGISALVRHGKNGLLTPPGDVNALAAAIEQLINDQHLRETLAANGRQTVLNSYDIRDTTSRLARIFRQTIDQHTTLR